jgi:subtilisin family serine protease
MQASAVMPDDPSFALQWGSDNIGQSVPFQESEQVLGDSTPGTPGDDDGAARAWQITTGSRSIVIGEVDTGVEYTHPDLAANIWSNPGGIGGCAAGTHGYSVLNETCNPMDTDGTYGGHGTHVAGIMGAVGNNGIGVAGINWQTTILPVKWLNSVGSGSTSSLIEALQWLLAAKQAGVNVRVVNDSAVFYGTASSQALSNEIETLGANNILFVTAAGNTGDDNDEVAGYPCGYDLSNEICVTASNDHDELPPWANYGPNTVNLAAPGVSIYSTLRGDDYGYLSGGSMASPQIAGAAALILSVEPSLSAAGLKADIDDNVQPVAAMSGKLISGGVLDICKALPGCESQTAPSARPSSITPPAITGGALVSQEQRTPQEPKARVVGASLFANSSGFVKLTVACPVGVTSCTGVITLRSLYAVVTRATAYQAKRLRAVVVTVASGSFTVAGGHTTTVRLHLSPTARRLLARTHVLRLRATIVAHDPTGLTQTTQTTVLLHASRAPDRGTLLAKRPHISMR